ncbi:prenyltransferase [Methanobacterium sp.]|uniref:prenyltransferase n=1 Tax=Methanobacterium sp. TaxID=2164 RepID=UPI003C7528BC
MNLNYNKLVKIVKLGRFQFLLGGILYFCMGAFLAVLLNAEFSLDKFLLGYAILFTAHLSMHYSNDYFDLEADKCGKPSQFAGGSGILIENPELKKFSKWFSVVLLSLSLIIAAVFVVLFSYSIWFFLFMVFANLLGWFYAAPPLRLSYNKLGELATISVGFVMPAIGYLTLTGTIDILFIIFSIPLLIYQMLFISAVQIPDMEGDKLGGKITWIVSKGRKFGFKVITVSAILATLSFFSISITNLYPPILNFKVITLISTIPLILAVLSYLKRTEDRKKAMHLVNQNLISLIIFLAITNFYFLYLIK